MASRLCEIYQGYPVRRAGCAPRHRSVHVHTRQKKEVRDELRFAESDVFVVVQEIEGWYLAGASDALCRDLGINQPRTTHHVTKEKLKRLCPGEYSTLGEFKLDLLDSFDLDRAINRNSSFAYFCRHMGLASGG